MYQPTVLDVDEELELLFFHLLKLTLVQVILVAETLSLAFSHGSLPTQVCVIGRHEVGVSSGKMRLTGGLCRTLFMENRLYAKRCNDGKDSILHPHQHVEHDLEEI